MVALDALALAFALTGAGDTVLLEFSANWCGPCKTVEPTVRRLEADGYPIRRIDVDQDRQSVAAFRVTSVPCFVMLVDGQEVDRVVGAASHDRLLKMFSAARFRPSARVGGAASESLPAAAAGAPAKDRSRTSSASPDQAGGLSGGAVTAGVSRNADPSDVSGAIHTAIQATVRIRVDDPKGQSIGTGTVIDAHHGEMLVCTCGHLFRDSAGKGAINIDVFSGGNVRTVSGQLLSYDLERDVAFVAMTPGVDIQPVPVASAGHTITRGGEVFSVGCDRGGEPRVIGSRITAIDRYLGPPNLEVAGQPVDGRSGGGLFSRQGYLIGVCNAADPADNEGIFAALPAIHWGLDAIGQRTVYQPRSASAAPPAGGDRPAESLGRMLAGGADPNGGPRADPAPPPAVPQQMPDMRLIRQQEAGADLPSLSDAEVICIVRSRGRPAGSERLYILEQPSQELLRHLLRESRPSEAAPNEIALQPVRESQGPAAWPNRRTNSDQRDGDVIRAQSADR